MERIFSDTSVLLSYIQHWVEENDCVVDVIDSGKWELHTGTTGHDELTERRYVRTRLYSLVLAEEDIEAVDPEELPDIRPEQTGSDIGHLDDLIEVFEELSAGETVTVQGDELEYEGPEDNPFFFREYQAEARAREREIKQSVIVLAEKGEANLIAGIDDEIDNYQDSKVLAEAVKWRYAYPDSQPDKVVTLDLGDMYYSKSAINRVISNEKSPNATLDIVRPKDIS